MAFRNFVQIIRQLQIAQVTVKGNDMHLHKNRTYTIESRRKFSCKCPEVKPKPPETCKCTDAKAKPPQIKAKAAEKEPTCANKTCPKKKPGFWGSLFGKKEPKSVEKPPIECCRLRQAQCKPDPDLSSFGGTPYKTCGPAYLIQKDQVPTELEETSKENDILRKIETDPELKNNLYDPMPAYKSVEQRMLDLNERKLHPFYKRYNGIKPKRKSVNYNTPEYKSRSGPIQPEEVPSQVRFNKELLEQKNLYSEYKRVDPPQQLLAKVVEIRKNEKPTLERKRHSGEKQAAKAVYETLYQKETPF